MSRYKLTNTTWVAEDGSYGQGHIVLYDYTDLTPEQQKTMEILPDYDKSEYVMAVLDGDDLTEWEDAE
jgi:hypothetical protein